MLMIIPLSSVEKLLFFFALFFSIHLPCFSTVQSVAVILREREKPWKETE